MAALGRDTYLPHEAMEFAFNRPRRLSRADDSYPNHSTGGVFFVSILYIALGGVAGTLARYGLQGWIQPRAGTFPAGTLVVNLVGSLALGFVLRFATGSIVVSPDLRGGLTIGYCGAFTTMSTFSYETIALLSGGAYWRAGLYMGGTILGCLAAVALGTAIANRLL
jgi:CrcB protein